MRRVVVTGLGVIAPTGNCVRQAWESALTGSFSIGRISLFDASDLPVQIAAEVKGFDPTSVMSEKEARQSSRFVQFAVGAVREALEDSGLELAGGSDRYGCAIGVGIGAFHRIERQAQEYLERGPSRVSPLFIPYSIPNMAAGIAAIAPGLRGPSFCVATACASGTHTIGEAFLHVTLGTADVMVAGGAEAAISPVSVSAFAKMRALSRRNCDPQHASRPFDRDRDGFVIGEGSGVIVLEEYEHAKRRGARIYAEMVGFGSSADAHHLTLPAPEGDGVARCLAAAIRFGRVILDQVDYINAHGTSTRPNDAMESAAIETVFGRQAQRLAISSTKGVTGHCLGAAGAVEAVYTVLAVHHGVIPPTANYETPDPACRLDYVPNDARERTVRYALSNSCGFGGQNGCIALKRFS